MIARKLKDNMNLVQKADEETVRRAIVRVLTESCEELEAIERKVEAAFAKRKKTSARDKEYHFARSLEDELKKHGA